MVNEPRAEDAKGATGDDKLAGGCHTARVNHLRWLKVPIEGEDDATNQPITFHGFPGRRIYW